MHPSLSKQHKSLLETMQRLEREIPLANGSVLNTEICCVCLPPRNTGADIVRKDCEVPGERQRRSINQLKGVLLHPIDVPKESNGLPKY